MSGIPSSTTLGLTTSILRRGSQCKTSLSSLSCGPTPRSFTFKRTSRTPLFGSSPRMGPTHALRLTRHNSQGLSALLWMLLFGRLGHPPNANSSLGSLSKTECGRRTDLPNGVGPMAGYAPYADATTNPPTTSSLNAASQYAYGG
jgi:hypothetical protein